MLLLLCRGDLGVGFQTGCARHLLEAMVPINDSFFKLREGPKEIGESGVGVEIGRAHV